MLATVREHGGGHPGQRTAQNEDPKSRSSDIDRPRAECRRRVGPDRADAKTGRCSPKDDPGQYCGDDGDRKSPVQTGPRDEHWKAH